MIAADTETFLIGPNAVAPPMVCLAYAMDEDAPALVGNNDPEFLKEVCKTILEQESVWHNASFDLSVIASTFPDLIPVIFEALEDDRIHCTMIREMMLNLAEFGHVDKMELPDGSSARINYQLAELERRYLGIDREDQKTGEDAWRTNFSMLNGMAAEDYPEDAVSYVLADAASPLEIYAIQSQRGEEVPGCESLPGGIFTTEGLHVGAAFALQLITCWGFAIDPEAKAEVDAYLERELAPEKLNLLFEHDVLRPAVPPRLHKRQVNKFVEATGLDPDGPFTDAQIAEFAAEGFKFTKPQKEKLNKSVLQEIVLRVQTEHGIEAKMTDPTDKFPDGQVSTDKDTLKKISHLDPILAQFEHRQTVQKLVTTEMPRLTWEGKTAASVHPNFAVLKETGRTSSFAGSLYPSANIQNVDPRARKCYVARPGKVLCSTDFSGLELVTTAQKTYTLFGHSVMRDKLNAGFDLHAYMGSNLAMAKAPEFADVRPEDAYEAFLGLRTTNEDFYDHWRKFAKPVNLGLPGGLGPKTFVDFARSPYGVILTEEEAKEAKDIWLDTYPEMREYFDWVNFQCQSTTDPDLYQYVSPLGMMRRNCSYTSVCNGAAMQTPGAEAAKLATYWVQKACYDPTEESILYGSRCVAMIHDELIVEMPMDDLMHERAMEIEHLMVAALDVVCPDVAKKCESALMTSWSKKAKPVFDENGRLQIWVPQEKKAA